MVIHALCIGNSGDMVDAQNTTKNDKQMTERTDQSIRPTVIQAIISSNKSHSDDTHRARFGAFGSLVLLRLIFSPGAGT